MSDVEESRLKNKSHEIKIDKSRYDNLDLDNCMLSYMDHVILVYFKCCLCGPSKETYKYYQKVDKYLTDYTDILSMSNLHQELLKFKYLLFSEDQTAIFNLRSSKVEVDSDLLLDSPWSHFYYFAKDLDNNVRVETIKKCLMNQATGASGFNRKLTSLTRSST